MSVISEKTPMSIINPHHICDSIELFLKGKDNHFKQPELPHIDLCLSENTAEFVEPQRKKQKLAIQEEKFETLKNLFDTFLNDLSKLNFEYKAKISQL